MFLLNVSAECYLRAVAQQTHSVYCPFYGFSCLSSSISPTLPLPLYTAFVYYLQLALSSVCPFFPFSPTLFIGLSPILLSIFSQSFSILGQVGRLVLLLMSSRTKRVGPSHLHNSLTTTMNHTFNLTLLPTRQNWTLLSCILSTEKRNEGLFTAKSNFV